jgi:tetratricopeptide (TPR) repeat protein
MYSLSELVESQAQVKQARVVAGGVGLWVVWGGQLTRALVQTLQDYGGLLMAEASNQALWYFFDKDAFRALAKLHIWSRLNPLTIFLEAFPANLLVGWDLGRSVSVSAELTSQDIGTPTTYDARVHPKLAAWVTAVPGLTLKPAGPAPGLAQAEWKALVADPTFAYEASLGWYFVVKPLGNQLDRDFLAGWRSFFSVAEPALRRLGLKYLYNDACLIVEVGSLKLLKAWCKESLGLVGAIKADPNGIYWPCVMAAASNEELRMNEDLPRKLGLEWSRMTPDYPYMTLRHAFLLGSEYRINQPTVFVDRQGVDNWCYVSLSQEAESESAGSLQLVLPRRLHLGADRECFFCGLTRHEATDCPSHALRELKPEVWRKLARVSMEGLNELSQQVDETLANDPVMGLPALIDGEAKGSLLLQGMLEVNAACQLRTIGTLWRVKGKDWPTSPAELGPEEGEHIWAALEALRQGNLANAELAVSQSMQISTRNYQPRSVQALIELMKGDLNQALFYFQEAERLSYTQVQRALFLLLQGRLQEIQGDHERAIARYRLSQQQMPTWLDPLYRQGVCLVKMGFNEQAWSLFSDLIARAPAYFNRLLVDPELERGRFHLLSALWEVWNKALAQAATDIGRVDDLSVRLAQWFSPDHEFMTTGLARLDELKKLFQVKNFVAFHSLNQGLVALEAEFAERIESEIKNLDKHAQSLTEELRDILRESSWFPFPRLLHEFNRDFNYCAEKLNWMRSQSVQVAENFRKSLVYAGEVEERLQTLKNRLITLKVIRDATFFILLLGRNFVWIELASLILALALVPVLIYFSGDLFPAWVVELVTRQKWQIQKGLILILSILALAVSALRTAILFEKKKTQLFSRQMEESAARKAKNERKAAAGKGKAKAKGAKAAAPAKGKKAGKVQSGAAAR